MSGRARIVARKCETHKKLLPSRIRQADHSQSLHSPVDNILFFQGTVGNQAVQRLVKSGGIQAKLKIGQPGDEYEREAGCVANQVMQLPKPRSSSTAGHGRLLGLTVSLQPASSLKISTGAQQELRLKPAQVKAFNFLGLSVGGGINDTMKDRLTDVENHLQNRFTAVHNRAPTNQDELRGWAGVRSIAGWRYRPKGKGKKKSQSKHCSGSAVDVNYTNQPYIVTRTQTGVRTEQRRFILPLPLLPLVTPFTYSYQTGGRTVLGGELAGSHLTAQRRSAVEVFDRAMKFVYGRLADVSARRSDEKTKSVYRRFRDVSDALSIYLGLAFHTAPNQVNRQPIANIESATEAQLLQGIPTSERKEESVAVSDINDYIVSHTRDLLSVVGPLKDPRETYHWNMNDATKARKYYFRMLRDYEHVRIPMAYGPPKARPPQTRNPARGFLDMTEEFVVAMTDVGRLRWGIADLKESESGDTHHFDLGNHGGVKPDCNNI